MPQKKQVTSHKQNLSAKSDESTHEQTGDVLSMSKRRALVVGINDYQGTANDLSSCVKDAESFKDFLNHNLGFTEIKLLTDNQATLTNIVSELDWLVEEGTPQDRLVFYFSGHGITKPNGNIMQEYLNLYDDLLDDNELIKRTKDLPQGVFTSIIDCCFSGGIEKRRYEAVVPGYGKNNVDVTSPGQSVTIDRAKVKTYVSSPQQLRGIEEAELKATLYKPFAQSAKLTPGGYKKTPEHKADQLNATLLNGTLIVSCLIDETAVTATGNTNGLSAFTYALLKVCSQSGMSISTYELISLIALELRFLGLRQTPRVKVISEGLLTRSLMNLNHLGSSSRLSPEILNESQLVNAVIQGLLTNQLSQPSERNFPPTPQTWRENMYTQFPFVTPQMHGHFPNIQSQLNYGWNQSASIPGHFLRHQMYSPQLQQNAFYPQQAFPIQPQPQNFHSLQECKRIAQLALETLPVEYRQTLYSSLSNMIPQIVKQISQQCLWNQQFSHLQLDRFQIEQLIANTLKSILHMISGEPFQRLPVNFGFQQFPQSQSEFGFNQNAIQNTISMVLPIVVEFIENEKNSLVASGLPFTAETASRISQLVISRLASLAPIQLLQSVVPPIVEALCRQYCLPVSQIQEPQTAVSNLAVPVAVRV